MNPTITGRIISATPTEQKTDTFRVRTFILLSQENVNGNVYENHLQFQLVNNNCELLDRVQPNQMVTVTYNPKGSMWTAPDGQQKCIVNLNAWKIEPAAAPQPQPTQTWGTPQPAQPQTAPQQAWGTQQPTPATPQQAWGTPQPQATPENGGLTF